MNIFQKINQLNHLTFSEKVLANYICSNPEEFLTLKPKEIADKTYISVPTIYRLVSKLGLEGINALKVELKTCLNQNSVVPLTNIDFPVLKEDSAHEAMQHLKEVYLKTLEDTHSLADYEAFGQAVALMKKAKQIDVYTSSANVYFAKNFQFQMQEICQIIHVPEEEYMQMLTACNSTSEHLAIVISFGGRSNLLQRVCDVLKKNKTPVILLTSTHPNLLCSYADVKLWMSSFENHYNKMSSFSTRMTILYLLDTLYSLYFQENYDENIILKTNNYRKMNPEGK